MLYYIYKEICVLKRLGENNVLMAEKEREKRANKYW